jgi:NADPH:quinone reductase-like Zn-dependent oxidoreductase
MQQYQLAKQADRYLPKLVEIDRPIPGDRQILIRVRAASLNYRDLIFSQGGMGDKAIGLVPLSDGAGEVVELGANVSRFQVGDRVAAAFFQTWIAGRFSLADRDSALGGAIDGMLSEYVVLHEDGLVKIPDYLSYTAAASLPCAAVTAWQGLFVRGDLQAGETVLTLGTGGVSIFALQLAVAQRAKVIITSSSDEKLARARQMGGWQTINYQTTPDWEKAVWELTDKQGIDHVIEVGGAGTYDRSLQTVAAGGQIIQIGILSGRDLRPNLFGLQYRNASISGIYVGSRQHFEQLHDFLTTHQIQPIIDRVFPFAAAAEAYRYLESGAHFGKVAIEL